jgi:hypothetical protein
MYLLSSTVLKVVFESSIFFENPFLQQHKIWFKKAHSGAAQNGWFYDGVLILLLFTAAQNKKFNLGAA